MKENFIVESSGVFKNNNYAGPKARKDLMDIFCEYKPLCLVKNENIFHQPFYYCRAIARLHRNADSIIVQYPFGIDNKFYRGISKYLIPKRSILWIHDIGSLRNEAGDRAVKKEIHLFNQFEYVVAHNASMIQWLKVNGCKAHLIDLQIFDYLYQPLKEKHSTQKNKLHFAGNLSKEKSCFVYNALPKLKNIEINLYGNNYEGDNSKLSYRGSFAPEELPNVLENGFGLVWDGTSAETCAGNFGHYLRYNNPHKTSLYLAAGIPVIIWESAALAPFIEKNGVGITIKSLAEIDDKIAKLSDKEYLQMVENAQNISQKLRSGYYSRRAVRQIRKGYTDEERE